MKTITVILLLCIVVAYVESCSDQVDYVRYEDILVAPEYKQGKLLGENYKTNNLRVVRKASVVKRAAVEAYTILPIPYYVTSYRN